MIGEDPIEMQKTQLNATAEMLARTFQDRIFYKAIIPDEVERKRVLPIVFKFRLQLGMRYAKVYLSSPKLEGAINMFPPKNSKLTIGKFMRAGLLSALFKVPRGTFSKFMKISNFFNERHEAIAPYPHYYIASLGVDPSFQGKGTGGKLVRFILQKADSAGLPCYLETQEERNLSIYKHLGFKIVEENTLPLIEIKNWIMIRHKNQPPNKNDEN